MDSNNNCFICAKELTTGEKSFSSVFYPNAKINMLLCQIIEISSNLVEKLDYCSACTQRIFYIQDLMQELERLEQKILHEKFVIEDQLKRSAAAAAADRARDQQYFNNGNDATTEQIRAEIVMELQAATISSMLVKIRQKRVGKRKKSSYNGTGSSKIMKSVKLNHLDAARTISGSNSGLNSQNSNAPPRDNEEEDIFAPGETQAAAYPNLNLNLKEEVEIIEEVGALPRDPLGNDNDSVEIVVPDKNGKIIDIITIDQRQNEQERNNQEFEASPQNISADIATKIKMSQQKFKDRLLKSKRHRKNSLICNECGHKCLNLFDLRDHLRITGHRQEFEFKCELCTYGTDRLNLLNSHMTTHTNTNKRQANGNKFYFMCPMCSLEFRSEERYRSHFIEKHGDIGKLV